MLHHEYYVFGHTIDGGRATVIGLESPDKQMTWQEARPRFQDTDHEFNYP